jgi:hypothetical protein
VSERRTAIDFAEELRHLVDIDYPEADTVVLVTDNLNIHSPGCLYEVFPPAEARRIASRIEWGKERSEAVTPEHGSWLNIAEIVLSVLHRQCLNRRIVDVVTLKHEIAAWQEQRNAAAVPVCWQLTTADARIKLRRLYPTLK